MLFGALVIVCIAISARLLAVRTGQTNPAVEVLSYAELTGSIFLPSSQDPFRPPAVRELAVPPFDDATAVWGATGRDASGHIWVGVSASHDGRSARLFEYEPDSDTWFDRGVVLEKLKSLGRKRDGEGQIKIHSRIVPASDGWLYFASTDEEGEAYDGSRPPRWGGHLWRVHPKRKVWEHLAAVGDGLVAVSGAGRFVYALGYFGHVLYQYDTAGGAVRRVVVGSAGGHVSRNFLTDLRGHAYVPRVVRSAYASPEAFLVEFDAQLREIATTPLHHYLGRGSIVENHGIVGVAYLPGGELVFTTALGRLYLIEPKADAVATVTDAGWFHPAGHAYAPSLFSIGGGKLIAGVARRGSSFEWVVSELGTRVSAAFPLNTRGLAGILLYGSISKDNAGRLYVVGWASRGGGGKRPLVLQVDPGQ